MWDVDKICQKIHDTGEQLKIIYHSFQNLYGDLEKASQLLKAELEKTPEYKSNQSRVNNSVYYLDDKTECHINLRNSISELQAQMKDYKPLIADLKAIWPDSCFIDRATEVSNKLDEAVKYNLAEMVKALNNDQQYQGPVIQVYTELHDFVGLCRDTLGQYVSGGLPDDKTTISTRLPDVIDSVWFLKGFNEGSELTGNNLYSQALLMFCEALILETYGLDQHRISTIRNKLKSNELSNDSMLLIHIQERNRYLKDVEPCNGIVDSSRRLVGGYDNYYRTQFGLVTHLHHSWHLPILYSVLINEYDMDSIMLAWIINLHDSSSYSQGYANTITKAALSRNNEVNGVSVSSLLDQFNAAYENVGVDLIRSEFKPSEKDFSFLDRVNNLHGMADGICDLLNANEEENGDGCQVLKGLFGDESLYRDNFEGLNKARQFLSIRAKDYNDNLQKKLDTIVDEGRSLKHK